MHIFPEHPGSQRIVRWLERNGCRHWISTDDPVIVRGNVVEYTAIARKAGGPGETRELDRRHIDRQFRRRDLALVPLGRKHLRIRVPLSRVL